MRESEQAVTMAEIARLAGARSASVVWNWRRRAPNDFPAPVARRGRSDLFDEAEVHDWLAQREARARRRRAPQWSIESIGELGPFDDTVEVALELLYLTVAASRALPSGVPAGWPGDVNERIAALAIDAAHPDDRPTPCERTADAGLPARVWKWLQARLELGASRGVGPGQAAELFDELLDLRARRRLRAANESRTASWVGQLVVALASADHGRVLDPACGEAGFLIEASGEEVELIGWESDSGTLRVARQRLTVHNVGAALCHVDSLGRHEWQSVGADAVICDAPFGLRRDADEFIEDDPRWVGAPPAPIADLGWLELSVHHLAEGGRAAVLLPLASLYRGGSEARVRTELLERGLVEAIVALPPRTALYTETPVALWLLRSASGKPGHGSNAVLMIDAAGETIARAHGSARAELSEEALMPELNQQIIEAVDHWRSNGERHRELPGFAAAVDRGALIEANADLVPERWVASSAPAEQFTRRIAAAVRDRARTREALASAPPLAPVVESAGYSPPRRRIRELIADGRLVAIAGSRIDTTEERRGGERVIGPWDFRDEEPRFAVTNADLQRTRRGDVIVMPTGGQFKSFVDGQGGCLLAAPLQALRIVSGQGESSEGLDARVLAAFIAKPGIRVTSGLAGRPTVKDIDVPLLEPKDAERLAEVLEAIDEDERRAREAASADAEMRKALLAAAKAGWRASKPRGRTSQADPSVRLQRT